ncbi:DedA family protein [Candidatus Gracilibacteria bacterium]|nr:DedA family protein [Candidatus Gracilibacteria bacterium]
MTKKTKKIILKILKILFQIFNILLILLTIFLTFVALFKKERIENFIEGLKVQVEHLGMWNYVIAGSSAGIENIPVLGNMLPGQNILLLVGGFFGNVSVENVIYLIVIATIGGIIGNFIGFFLGKEYGEEFFKKYGIWIGIGKTEVKYLEKGIHKWGAWGIIIGKFHPITRAFLPFIAGSMKMTSAKFIIYNAIASFVYALVIVGIGVLFVQHYKVILDYLGHIMLGIIIIAGLYIYFYKREAFNKYMKEKNLEMMEMEAGMKKKFKKK